MNSRSLLKQFVKGKRLSIEGWAFKSGRSYSTVVQFLAGKELEEETLQDLANGLEISIEELRRLMTGDAHKAVG